MLRALRYACMHHRASPVGCDLLVLLWLETQSRFIWGLLLVPKMICKWCVVCGAIVGNDILYLHIRCCEVLMECADERFSVYLFR